MSLRDIDRALERATRFVLDHQSADGAWRDFRTDVGVATSWTTGYALATLAALRQIGIEIRDQVVEQAIALLVREQAPGRGWGYNHAVQSDADSTAWALLGIHAWRPETAKVYRHIVLRYVGARGGFRTFIDLERSSFWQAEHADVTASCLQAMLALDLNRAQIETGLDSLLSVQREDGLWDAYWYVGTPYTTLHALRALAMAGIGGFDEAVRAKGYGCEYRVEGQAVQLAMVLEARALVGSESEGVESLLLQQQAVDGRWISAPFMRVTDPDQATPWIRPQDSGPVVKDQNCLFSTCTVINSLIEYRNNLSRIAGK